MALPVPIEDFIQRHFSPTTEEPEQPFEPQTPDEMLGVEIIFRYPNRYNTSLYPDKYVGKVIAWFYSDGREDVEFPRDRAGLYLVVNSRTFNLTKEIHETDFVGYGWEAGTMTGVIVH